jgi:hypothetical protein
VAIEGGQPEGRLAISSSRFKARPAVQKRRGRVCGSIQGCNMQRGPPLRAGGVNVRTSGGQDRDEVRVVPLRCHVKRRSMLRVYRVDEAWISGEELVDARNIAGLAGMKE